MSVTGTLPEDVARVLHAAFQRERATGYTDLSVFGGFSRFAVAMLARGGRAGAAGSAVRQARAALEGYAQAPVAQRRVKLDAAARALGFPTPETGRPAPSRGRVPASGAGGHAGSAPSRAPGPAPPAPDPPRPGAGLERVSSQRPRLQDPRRESPLARPVQFVKGVGPRRAALLERLGIRTVGDLLFHFPRDYLDRSRPVAVGSVRPGDIVTLQGVVSAVTGFRPRSRRLRHVARARLADASGSVTLVWFNQPYVADRIPPGAHLVVAGRAERGRSGLEVHVQHWEPAGDPSSLEAGRIVPIHPATEGVDARALRRWVRAALDLAGHAVPEVLPAEVLKRRGLVGRRRAVFDLHFPPDAAARDAARRRMAFEDFFVLQCGLLAARAAERGPGEDPAAGGAAPPGIAHTGAGPVLDRFFASLPFALTRAQRRVIGEIFADMARPVPMRRLLQGDVGSGKTVVAAAALAKAAASGSQGALMAPTELLAAQHHRRLAALLEPAGIRVVALFGSQSPAERREAADALASGLGHVAVGTHALVQEGVRFHRLGLAITDEQHRFGVRHRAGLQAKGSNPDVLVMTATPIPRTLALTLYGDLDVSVLDELPPGRTPVRTRWVPASRRPEAYAFVRREVEAGRQAYVVCPVIEESEVLEVEAATRLYEELRAGPLEGLAVGLLHGRLPAGEREATMRRFVRGELDVLVATTIIEVGVDVPNATVMVIEGAERFGLAQLHQLRGRVGRGSARSTCFLVGDPATPEGKQRLGVLTRTSDGFRIAEEDLRLRGPGEFFGTRQHGLPELRVANLLRDAALLEEARADAQALLAEDPQLLKAEHRPLRQEVEARFGENAGLIRVG